MLFWELAGANSEIHTCGGLDFTHPIVPSHHVSHETKRKGKG
jgi:hypothetical protein